MGSHLLCFFEEFHKAVRAKSNNSGWHGVAVYLLEEARVISGQSALTHKPEICDPSYTDKKPSPWVGELTFFCAQLMSLAPKGQSAEGLLFIG